MAAAKAAPSTKPSSPGILPVALPALEHHLATLEPVMAQWKTSHRIPPVLLLTGAPGVGKRSMAHYLSQWLLCESSGLIDPNRSSDGSPQEDEASFSLFGEPDDTSGPSTRPCGECSACQRAIHGNWVDFTEISPEGEEGEAGTLKIDQFRQLKSSLGFGAFDGSYRITLIRDADRLTIQAANSLLKILEEPPPGWVFLLTASDPSTLLPTLVSRCQTLRLKPLPAETIVELLSGLALSPERRRICAELAQGSWGKALALADDELWDHRSTLFKFLEEPQAELNGLVDWASAQDSHFQLMLDQLEQISLDLIQWSLSGGQRSWTQADGKRALEAHVLRARKKLGSDAAARRFWTDRSERIFRARQEARAPLNRKLLIQSVLAPWLEV